MESSFLEDFLKREVDQNQVNALVGTLENAIGPSKTTLAPTGNSAGKIISVGQIVSQCASTNSGVPSLSKIIATTSSSKLTIVTTSSPTAAIKTNGTNHNIKNVVISAASSTPSTVVSSQQPVRISPVVSRQTLSSPSLSSTAAIISNGGSPRVSIAPKSAVPIAPRLGTNIVLTPRQAQILMAQQRFNPLLRNNLIARMPGTIPVMPRIHGPRGTIAVPPIINTQISGHVPRAIINMAGAKVIDPQMMMRMNVPLTTASLTQIKQTANVIPGQINYRFRAVNPNISSQPPPTPVTVNGVTTTSSVNSTNNTAVNITMMKESVKRLKEFFQNLINLASGPNQPPEIGRMVKELVHNLMVLICEF